MALNLISYSTFSQPLLSPSTALVMWLEHLLVMTEAKMSLGNQVFNFLLECAHVLSILPFIAHIFIESFLVTLDTSAQISFCQCFSLLTRYLPAWTMSLYSSQATCPCYHPLSVFFFCLSLSRTCLFVHSGLLAFLPDFHFVVMHHS